MKLYLLFLAIIFSTITTEVKALSCGDIITRSVALTENLTNCPDTALTVIKSGVVIKLNGFTIDGVGVSSAISIFSELSNVQILGPGVIREFGTGISVGSGSEHVISEIIFDNNISGIFAVDVSDVTIKNNDVINGRNGITLMGNNSNNNLILDNYINDMNSEAIWLIEASNNQIYSNYLFGNQIGISLASSNKNNFSYNHVINNNRGIQIGISPSGMSSSYNELSWNKIYDNNSAVSLSSSGSTSENIKNSLYKNAVRGGSTGLTIWDSGNLKTIVTGNSFSGQSDYHIVDDGTSTQFSGNRCEGIACP